jgi:hypothetical protein
MHTQDNLAVFRDDIRQRDVVAIGVYKPGLPLEHVGSRLA